MTFAHRRYAREVALMALCLAERVEDLVKAALDQALELFDDEEVRSEVLPPGPGSPTWVSPRVPCRKS